MDLLRTETCRTWAKRFDRSETKSDQLFFLGNCQRLTSEHPEKTQLNEYMIEWLLTNVSISSSRTRISCWWCAMQSRSDEELEKKVMQQQRKTQMLRIQNEEEGMALTHRTECRVFDQSIQACRYGTLWQMIHLLFFRIRRSWVASCEVSVFKGIVLQSDHMHMFPFQTRWTSDSSWWIPRWSTFRNDHTDNYCMTENLNESLAIRQFQGSREVET